MLRGPRRQHRGLRVELPAPDARDPAARGARRGRPGDARTTSSASDFLIRRPLLQALEVDRRRRAGAAHRRDRPGRRGVRGVPARDPVRLPGHGPGDRHDQGRAAAAGRSSPRTGPARSTTRSSAAASTTGSTTRPRRRSTRSCSRACPRHPSGSPARSSGFVHRLREADLTKVPGIAETLDWAAALLSLGARELHARARRRDARRRPQVRGGHPPGPRRAPRVGSSPRPRPAAERPMTDPAVVRPPFGAEVDGRRLLGEAVGFGRALRAARLSIDLGASVDFARALTLVDIGDREQVRGAGAAIFVRRRDDRATYDAVFDRWWRRRGSRLPSGFEPPPIGGQERRGRPRLEAARRPRRPATAARRPSSGPTSAACRCPTSGDEDAEDDAPIDGVVVSPDAYTPGRGAAPPRVRPDDAGRAARGRAPRRPARAAARAAPDPPLRAPLARPPARAAGDVPAQPRHRRPAASTWVWRRPIREPRSLVVLCDISGSMERHSRLLLRFVQALSAASRGPHGVVRVRDAADAGHAAATRPRPRPRARPRVRRGERLGRRDAHRRIVPRRSTSTGRAGRCARSGVVIVVSDGWDRGDPALVATETARLRRNCHRLVWLNPLAGTPGYQPLAGGMRAAYPVHRRLPAGRHRREPRAARRDPRRRPGQRHAARQRGGVARGPARLGGTGRDRAARRGRRQRRSIPPHRGRSDEGAARHPRRLGARRASPSVARSSSGRSGRRRGPRAPCCCTPTTAGSRARSAAVASRAPRPRRSTRHAPTATPGSSATGSATSRRGTWGWLVAGRSTCSWSRSRRPP